MAGTERVVGLPPRPSLDDVAERVGNELWLAALALLRLSPAVAVDAAQWTSWDEQSGCYSYDDREDAGLPADLRARTLHPHVRMDWDGWVADFDTAGRVWSGSEHRLFALVAALVVDGRAVSLRGVLDQLGSWEADALVVLVQRTTGSDNREHPGRFRATPSTELVDHAEHAGHGEAGGGHGPREPRPPGGPSKIGRPGGVGGDNTEAERG